MPIRSANGLQTLCRITYKVFGLIIQVENELTFVFGFKYSVNKHEILTSFKKGPFSFFCSSCGPG